MTGYCLSLNCPRSLPVLEFGTANFLEYTQMHFKCRHVSKLEDPDVRLALSRTLSNNISHRTGEGLPLWNAWNVYPSHALPTQTRNWHLPISKAVRVLIPLIASIPPPYFAYFTFWHLPQVGTGSHQMDPFSIQLSKLGSARPFRCRVVFLIR